MQRLECDNMGVEIDARQLHHLSFGDVVALMTLNISQAERMLADFNEAVGKIGLHKRKRAAGEAFKSIEDIVRKTRNTRPVHLLIPRISLS
uniref:Resolvase/invertase-type recombinase catalytic domain-containing protein n=1 Tax=Angiostrongylus cantonensis TaxID=6313 RepID=A0A0K0DH48_ANGCA